MATDPTTSWDNPTMARLVNKIVFSRALRSVMEAENWKNAKLVRGFDSVEEGRSSNPEKTSRSAGPTWLCPSSRQVRSVNSGSQ